MCHLKNLDACMHNILLFLYLFFFLYFKIFSSLMNEFLTKLTCASVQIATLGEKDGTGGI